VKKSKILRKLINSSLIIILVVLFTKISLLQRIFFQKTPLYDFDLYYSLINSIKHGINPYSPGLTFSLGPPLVFLYFFPFSFLALEKARVVATLINITSGFVLCFLLAKKFNKKYLLTTFLVLVIVFFSAFLPRYSLGMGQPSILLTLFITYIICSKNSVLKGISLAIASSLKTILLFPILAFIKNKKFLIVFLLTLVLLTLLSLTFIKVDWYKYYFQNIFISLNNSPLASSGIDSYNQSLKSTLFRFGLFDLYKIIFIPVLIIASLFIAITANFELSVITAILLSPISWQHYFVVLFPIFVAAVFKMKWNFKNLSIFTVSFILWFVQFPWLNSSKVGLVTSILASHFFISGLMLFYLIWNNRNTKLGKKD